VIKDVHNVLVIKILLKYFWNYYFVVEMLEKLNDFHYYYTYVDVVVVVGLIVVVAKSSYYHYHELDLNYDDDDVDRLNYENKFYNDDDVVAVVDDIV